MKRQAPIQTNEFNPYAIKDQRQQFASSPYCNEEISFFDGTEQLKTINFSVMVPVPPQEAFLTLVTEHHLRRCERNVESAIILRMTELRLTKRRGTAIHNTLRHIYRAMPFKQEPMAILAKVGYADLRRDGAYILACANILSDILPSTYGDIRAERKRVQYHIGRASRVALPATLTLEQWLQTLDHYNWRCAFCPGGEYEVLEHYIPLIHGGGTTQYNCIPACASCNSRKNDMHPSMIPLGKGLLQPLQNVQQYLEARRVEAGL